MQALKDAIAKGRSLLDAFEARIATVEQSLSDELHEILGGIHADLGAASAPATAGNDTSVADAVGSGYVAPAATGQASPPTQAV